MYELVWVWVKIAGGLAVLVGGGELLVRGASRLAAALRISSLVIGLTVVAFGTSAPELAVSVQAGVAGNADLALGNVVGSNIFNVLFILGVSALIVPLFVSSQLVRWDVPLMLVASLLVLAFGSNGTITRWEGLVLFAGIAGYTWWCLRQSRKESVAVQAEYAQEWPQETPRPRAVFRDLLLIEAASGRPEVPGNGLLTKELQDLLLHRSSKLGITRGKQPADDAVAAASVGWEAPGNCR